MPMPGPTELLIILAIVVLIFGASRIGKLGGALGQSIREFKEAKDAGETAEAPTKLAAKAEVETKESEA
jgi:sec-independent protein translocase protein TatA